MAVVGKCQNMCPIKEFHFRQKHHLLHFLEYQANLTNRSQNLQQICVETCIKEFRRSAAGDDLTDPACLRPVPVLKKTIEYLFSVVLQRSDVPFPMRYDFIFDRLRSVRQDAVIQQLEVIDPSSQIIILERCVKFYLYAAYRLELDETLKIDSHINASHAADSMKSLLQLYSINSKMFNKEQTYNCLQITAACVLYNMKSSDILFSILFTYPNCLTKSFPLSTAIDMFFLFSAKNFIRFNKLVRQLIERKVYLPLYALSTIIRQMRTDCIEMLCHSHHSKSSIFPSSELCKWLLLTKADDVSSFCSNFNLSIDNLNIKLSKSEFKSCAIKPGINGCLVFNSLHQVQRHKLSRYLIE